MARAKALRFTGTYDASGQPDRWFSGIPARDLSPVEVTGLSDEEYANATGGPDPLYVPAVEATKKAAPGAGDRVTLHPDAVASP